MKRSDGDAFESGYDQPQQLKQQQQQQQQQQLRQKTLISPISKIRIGEWSVEAIHRDHIMLKCYFAKRKLLWEFLDKSAEADSEGIKLKRKMEMDWSHLSSCEVHIDPQDNTGILQVELNKRPTFYIETNQRPGKHTEWKLHEDFTTNRSASSNAIHTLYFTSGELQKNLEKLLSGDNNHFWSTLLHIEHPNNNNPNGSTNGLNVNCPNFNMEERQHVNWGNDDGREVVLNSAAQNLKNSSELMKRGEYSLLIPPQFNRNQNHEIKLSNNNVERQVWGNDERERDALNSAAKNNWSDELKYHEGYWYGDYHLSLLPETQQDLSCPLQPNLMMEDVNMENMEQLYRESVFDHMPPLEPIPLTVLKSSDPLREAQGNANSRIMSCLPQNMESSDLEYALKTSNPPGETQLQQNSTIVQDPNLQNTEQLHWESVYDHMPPLEPIPQAVLKSFDEAEANANSRMMYLPENNMESLDLEDALNTSNPPGETQQQPNSMIAQDPNLQLYWESVYDQMPPLEPIPEAVLETSTTTTPQLDVVLETLDFDFEYPFLYEGFN